VGNVVAIEQVHQRVRPAPTEKTYVKRALLGVLCVVIVAVTFDSSIGVVYALFLPKIYPATGWGTHAPFLFGIMIATVIGGYIGYRVPATEKPLTKVGVGFCYAAAVAGLVSYLSIFIILNTRGS
jgi:uncharacterized membrane protein